MRKVFVCSLHPSLSNYYLNVDILWEKLTQITFRIDFKKKCIGDQQKYLLMEFKNQPLKFHLCFFNAQAEGREGRILDGTGWRKTVKKLLV